MKFLLEISDKKAGFILGILKKYPYVKTKTLDPSKEKFLREFKIAIEEVELAKKGKIKLQSGEDFLNEL